MNDIQSIALHMTATGSRVICNPPPTDTDEDWVIWAKGSSKDIIQFMLDNGYTKDGGDNYNSAKELDEGGFASFRKGHLNYIIVTSDMEYGRWRRATQLATHMNLIHKEDRVKLFQWFRDGHADA